MDQGWEGATCPGRHHQSDADARAQDERMPEGYLISRLSLIRKNIGANKSATPSPSWLPHVPFRSTGGHSALDRAGLIGVRAAAPTH